MIWGSIELMTAIDLAVMAVGVYVAVLIHRNRQIFAVSHTSASLGFIATGLFAILLFFAADLFAMWVLPCLIGRPAAMAAMADLLLQIAWFIIPVAACAIALGFTRTARSIVALLNRVDTTEKSCCSWPTRVRRPGGRRGRARDVTAC